MSTSTPRILSSLLPLLVLCGCGSRDETDSAPTRPMSLITDPVPSPRNAAQWKRLWDGKSWIVAWKKDKAPFRRGDVMAKLMDGILGFAPGMTGLDARFALSRDLGLELLPLAAHPSDEGISGFAVVRFQKRSPLWDTILNATGAGSASGLDAFQNLQWQALTTLPDAAWAEPNLESELFQADPASGYTLPPEMQTSPFSSVIHRIRADVAWEKSVDTDGLPLYEYEKRRSPALRWTNVAVIDTGVDWKHPDLWDDSPEKNRIFTNPGEELNCQDDDGNGYIDDLHGIDATVEMDDWNSAAKKSCQASPPSIPDPGPAEIGGVGKPCPGRPDGMKKENCGHGTHVAGIIAAKHGGEESTLGVCPSCRIVPIRVSDLTMTEGVATAGRIDDASQIRALSYVMGLVDPVTKAPQVRVINMSLGKYFVSRSLAYWYRRLLSSDILVVAAAGNDDTDTPNYPAAYDPVLAVCATSEDETAPWFGRGRYAKTGFSNFGVWVDICAPGLQIVSTRTGGGETSKSGTSQASPVVAGAAGFMKSVHPDYSAKQISMLLQKHANAPVLYHFGTSATDIPEGATKTNVRNRIYEGMLIDGIQFYMLGTGFLDLAAAITEGRECWDAANPATCVSYVYANGERRLQSQLDGGCVMSTVASSRPGPGGALASMPFVMVLVYSVHRLVRRLRQGRRHHGSL